MVVAAHLAAAELQPFRMPWNDASTGITNLQSWQPAAAGSLGWVQVTPSGHYAVNGSPIRFLGVNVGAASAMPTHAHADFHAARLARFGFNAVRLHHLEAPWDKDNVLIDYASGGSRTLSPDRLDKLHYFVAQLASHGIYSDVNLLVSREFQATDGLGAEIAQMGWKDQHVLGFFNDLALALHKEHATKLLTAPNPYRSGVPLGLDPAVSFVEIMNENGLLQKWLEGVLDTMPGVYRAQLQTRWNQWLTQKYASSAALLTGWGAVDQPLGANLLANAGFASGMTGWNGEQHDTALATFTGTADYNGASALKINVTQAGTASWHVQLNQAPLALSANGYYTISFWAKANQAVPLTAGLARAYGDYGGIGSGVSATLGTTWQKYTVALQNGAAETNARINFGGFGDRVCTVWFADVRVQSGGNLGGLPTGVTLEAANIPSLLRNNLGAGYTVGQRQDWTRFVLALETAYWNAMYAHIKTTLGYPGIVWGTIIANSPPNAQAGLDAMDSHAYWQHPTWPAGQDWDPVTWTIPNTSMVNDTGAGTIGGIARQRVQGKPHNVTEYEHPSPNSYTSEGPLLAAAYASLQDWDGLWMFAYETTEAEFVSSFFDHGTHPGRMANNLLAAAIFRRGDVSRANNEYTMAFSPDKETEIVNTTASAWSIGDGSHLGVPATLALASRVSLSIGASASGLTNPPAAPAGNSIASDTGELLWDNSHASKGVVTVNTAKTKAVIGFTDARSWNLGGVQIAPGATRLDWCTVGLTMLEGDAFDAAGGGRMLIVAAGDIENTNQVWKDSTHTSLGSNWGTAPTKIEVVMATITLPVAPSRVSAWALDERGQRGAMLTVSDFNGQARLVLGSNGVTPWYEVVIAPTAPVFSLQPLSQAVLAGHPVTFTAAAGAAPTFQWRKNNVAIPGATGSSYTIASVLVGNVGTYSVVATNSTGSATSHDAVLTISTGGVTGTVPAGFNASSYLARYPEVAAVFGTDLYAAWEYYRDYGIYLGETFDELFRVEEYLTLYPELFAVFGNNLKGALLHWLNEGSIEGRLGRIPLEFSATGYLSRNPDVAAAVNNDALLAWSHYWLYGIYEGRAYDEELRVFEYLAVNADLTAAFVSDWRAAALHWMRYGRTEGRLGRLPLLFNVTEYLTRSPDVAAAWGTHPTTVFLHYWGYGIDEGRTFDDEFRPAEYLALNADLAAVFGTDLRGAFKHWVRYGHTEGRPGRNP